jgi:eukaryotic-like serine/threonine-protein kinase
MTPETKSEITPERYRQVQQVLERALEYAEPERAAFLDAACGDDPALRREVESLLAADASAASFIESPAVARRTPAEAGESVAGMRLGAYRVVNELGRGGMGAVYLAVRADDLFEKRVAVKLVKRGMDTDEIVRRFEHERQILAALEHPNVARLIDAGATEDGRPYFVMEYVEGTPIDEYCARRELGVRARLELFRKVSAAVEYAHRHFIVHRDLKPSNILIGADGEPKLLDFGIAKLVQEGAQQDGTLTAAGLRPMTPEYASPEQARGETVTAASDVYSLGVVLYELLAGRRPYELKSRAPDEVLRVICGEEPEKPSLAAPRERKAEKLRRQLSGDLDNIVLTALRKEPERRYRSVEQLSEDIRRHLDGLPVAACRDTFGYRSAKFVRRHKVGVAAAAAVVVALLSGIVATAWQARRARAAQARAEQRFNDVRRLANSFMFDFHDAIQDLTGSTPARQMLVKKALEYLDGLAREAAHDPSLQRELATAYQKVGEIQGGAITRANIGDSAGAVVSHRKALALREALAAAHPADTQIRQELAVSYMRVSEVQAETGDAAGALGTYRQGLAIREALAAADPANIPARLELATAYRTFFMMQAFNGHYSAAVESLRQAIKVLEELYAADPANMKVGRQLTGSHMGLGDQMWLQGYPDQAWESYRRAQRVAEQMVARDAASHEASRALMLSYIYIGNMAYRYGDSVLATECAHKSLAIAEAAAARDPANAQAQRDLGIGYDSLAHAQFMGGDFTGAIKTYRGKVFPFYESAAAADPKSTRARRDLALLCTITAETHVKSNQLAQALELARKAQALCDALLKEDPKHVEIRRTAARTFFLLSQLLAKSGHASEARGHLTRALTLQKEQADAPQAVGDRINDYPSSLLTCEPTDLRDPATALGYAKLAAERTRENDPNILKTLALAYHLTGDRKRAVETAKKALALLPPRAPGKADSVLRRELEAQLAKSLTALNGQP